MTKTILVNYAGGYCGSFFAILTAKALNANHKSTFNSSTNMYLLLSDGLDTKYTKIFGKLFDIRRGILRKEDLTYISSNGINDFYKHALQVYNILHDVDEDSFIDNIKNYYKNFIDEQRGDYFVSTIHYAFKYKKLTLHDVFPDATVLHVVCENPRYARYFNLLFHFKTKNDEADKILQSSTLRSEQIHHDFIKPDCPKIFDDRSIPVDMGRLIFDRDYDHLASVEESLSKSLDKNISLDREAFAEYSNRNVDIIKKILGEDFMLQREEEQIEKCLDYVEKEVRNK